MNIRELESVLAVYNYKNYAEAAYQTHSSISTISKHVSRVEEELGALLFDRKTKPRCVVPTELGEALQPSIQRMVDLNGQMINQAQRSSPVQEQQLRIGYIPLVGTIGEREIITNFQIENPDVEIVHAIRFGPELMRMLYAGKVDGIFLMVLGDYYANRELWTQLCNEELEFFPLMENHTMKVGLSQNHPLAKKNCLCIDELLSETFIFSFNQDPAAYPQKIRTIMGLPSDEPLPIKIRLMDFIEKQVILDLVAHGFGVLPQICTPPQQIPGIRFVPVCKTHVACTGVFIYPKQNTSRVFRRFIRCAEQFAGAHYCASV